MSSDAVGGFVGLAGNGNGLTSTGRVQMGGLDYEKSPFYDAATNTWHPSVAGPDGGLDILKYQLTQQTYDKLQVPLGTDAMMIMQQRAADLAAQTPSTTGRTEYIPEPRAPEDVRAHGAGHPARAAARAGEQSQGDDERGER